MAFVRKRGSTWYTCYVDETGRQVHRASKARTKTECQRLADELERKAERVRLGLEDGAPEPVAFREVAETYLRVVTRGQRSANTTEGRIRNHLVPAFGDRLVHQIRPVELEAFLSDKQAQGLAAATRRHLRVHLHAIFDFAIHRMKVLRRENPMSDVPQVAVPPSLPKFLNPDQVQRFLSAAGDWWLLLLTAILTGLRKGELCGLRWTDVDLERRLIFVARSYDHDTTKGGRPRPVAIHRSLVEPLRAARLNATSPYVFPAPEGGMRRHFNAAARVRTVLKAADLIDGYELTCRRKGCGHVERTTGKVIKDCPECGFALWPEKVPMALTFKDLRSTFGTLAYEATGNIRFVQEQLGHADVRTTERHYSYQRAGHLIAQADLIPLDSQVPAGRNEEGRSEAKSA